MEGGPGNSLSLSGLSQKLKEVNHKIARILSNAIIRKKRKRRNRQTSEFNKKLMKVNQLGSKSQERGGVLLLWRRKRSGEEVRGTWSYQEWK